MTTIFTEESNWPLSARANTSMSYQNIYLYDKLLDLKNCIVRSIQLDLAVGNNNLYMYFISEDMKKVVKFHHITNYVNNNTISLNIDTDVDPAFQNDKKVYIGFISPNAVTSAFVSNAFVGTKSITGWVSNTGYLYNSNGASITTNFSATQTNGLRLKLVYENKINNQTLLESNNKTYSLETLNEIYETKMTSDTAPAPLKILNNAGVSASQYRYLAFDGKPNTFHWSSGIADNIYLGLDFGEPKVFDTLIFTDAPPNYDSQKLQGFYIEASNDNLNYEILRSLPNHVSQGALATETFYFNNSKPYRYYRIRDNIKTNHAIAVTELVFSKRKNTLTEIPSINKDVFLKYGKKKYDVSDSFIENKNYILQDTVSEDVNGLWTTQINRKPLSIKF